MRNFLFLVFFLPVFTQAQVAKDSKFLGGNISYTMQKYEPGVFPTSHFLNLEFYNGKFTSNTVAIGPMVSVEASFRQNLNSITNLYERMNSGSYLGGMFVRKYFPLGEKFFFALEGSIAAGIGVNSFSTGSNFNYKIAGTPMFIFQPVPKWAFLGRIGELAIQDRSNQSNMTQVQVNFGRVSFGLNYFLNQEKRN